MINSRNDEPRQPHWECPYCGEKRYSVISCWGSGQHVLEAHGLEKAIAWAGERNPNWREDGGLALETIRRAIKAREEA